ncbi:hypothetical protein BOX15_Mlig021666g1, partial [Macrostomum lignano]
SGTLKSSIARLARLFLGRKSGSSRQKKAKQKPGEKLTAESGVGCYGSLARQPGLCHDEGASGCQVRAQARSWRSQESLASGDGCSDAESTNNYYCGNALMSRSVHADLAIAAGDEPALPDVSHSVDWLASPATSARPAAPLCRPGRIVVMDASAAADVAEQARPPPGRSKIQLAVAVRAKELELEQLRRTMEQNEAALQLVFEERRAELKARLEFERAIGAELAPAVSQANRRARQSDQAATELRAVSEQRQSEARALRSRLGEIELETREKAELERRLQLQLAELAESLESATQRLRQRPGSPRDADAVASRACQTGCESAADCEPQLAADEQLEAEIAAAKLALEEQSRGFSAERDRWLYEKRQVLAYQKQLQLNLVQLRSKTTRLATDVEQLNSELAEKETLLMRLRGQAVLSGGVSER